VVFVILLDKPLFKVRMDSNENSVYPTCHPGTTCLVTTAALLLANTFLLCSVAFSEFIFVWLGRVFISKTQISLRVCSPAHDKHPFCIPKMTEI